MWKTCGKVLMRWGFGGSSGVLIDRGLIPSNRDQRLKRCIHPWTNGLISRRAAEQY